MQQCIYVSASWGIHDVRWFNALGEIGFDAIPCRLGYEASDIQGIRAILHNISNPEMPILAGPLHTVTRHLLGVPGRLVGLSWGFDMYASDDLAWLSGLEGLIVDSHATQEIAESSGLEAERITFMPWGVDLNTFTPSGPVMEPSTWGIPDGARIILSLRAHEPIYRVGDILRAFALTAPHFPDAYLLIGNEGSLTAELRREAHDLDVDNHVRFIGLVEEDQLPALMRSSHIYISASEVDGTSVTLLQAMACQAPVIVSDTPGNLGWVQHGVTGSTFTIGDPESLAQQLLASIACEHSETAMRAREQVQKEANWSANLERLQRALVGA